MNLNYFLKNIADFAFKGLYKNKTHYPWFSETQITYPNYFALQIGKHDFNTLLNNGYVLGSEFGLVQQKLIEKGFPALRSKEEAIDILLKQGFTEDDWQFMEIADKGFPPFMEDVETIDLTEYTSWYYDGTNLFFIKENDWILNLPPTHSDFVRIESAILHQDKKKPEHPFSINSLHENTIDDLLVKTYSHAEVQHYFDTPVNFLNQNSFEKNTSFLTAILKAFNTPVETELEVTNHESMIQLQDVDLFDMDDLDEDWMVKR